MASVFGSNSDDILIPTAGGNDYRGLAGSDTYIITNLIPAGATLTIVDTEGANKIQLIDGLTIKASSFTSSAVQLTLSNDAVITILGATGFTFDLGLNVVAGDTTGTPAQTYAQLATALGVPALPAPGAPPVAGTPGVVIGVPPIPTFTIDGAAAANEGTSATYTVTLSSPQAVATTVKVGLTGTGATIGTDTGTMTASGTGVTLAGGVLTFAAGSTTATLTVPIVLDTEAETGETITLTLSDATGGPTIGTKAAKTTTLGEVPVTFALTGATSVFEGDTATYTVTASRPIDADTKVSFTLAAADPGGAGTGTSKTNLADFAEGAFNTFSVTIPKGSTTATYTVTALDDAITELEETYTVSAVAGSTALGPATTTLKDGATGAGQTFTLTTGVDTMPGLKGSSGSTVTTGDDTILGTLSAVAGASTWSALDNLDAGTGNDKFIVSDVSGGVAPPGGSTIVGVESLVWASAGAASVDTTTGWISGLTSLTVGANATSAIRAASTTAITATQATGDIDVNGGASQTITSGAANITSGTAGTPADDTKGNVSITHSKFGTSTIQVNGGAAVTVNASGANGGAINVGQTGAQQSTGTVKITSTGNAYDATGPATLGAINVKGGTSVEVTQTAYSSTSDAASDTTANTRTQGLVNVDGNGTASSVSVVQSKAVTAVNAVTAVTAVNETATVTFVAMTAGQTATVNGLTFTASKSLTAAEVAAAFANLSAGAFQGKAPASNGIYSGQFDAALANGLNMTTGASAADKVVFTEGTASTAAFALPVGGTAAPSVTATTAGVTAITGVTGVAGIAGGAVAVSDSGGTNKVASVTLSGYGTGSSVASNALTALSLADSAGTLGVTSTLTGALGLTVSGLATGATVNMAAAGYTAMNMVVNGASTFALTAPTVQTVSVSGTAVANVSGGALAAVKTITVTGSAGINLPAAASATIESIDASGTSGAMTASIDPAKATYKGGSGTDTVTTAVSTAISKAIDLGGGDDTLRLLGGTTGSSVAIEGGTGTDTLEFLTAADAFTLSGTAGFGGAINSFEKVKLAATAGTGTLNTANLDNVNYVITTGGTTATTAEVQSLVITGPASGTGTVPFLGSNVKVTTGDSITTIGNTIVANKAAIIGAWNAANPDREIADITNAAGTLTVTYRASEGNVAVIAAQPGANGVAFNASTETTPGAAGGLNITNYGAAGTLELTAAGAAAVTSVSLLDASGGADVLNVVMKSSASIDVGLVSAPGVETINLTSTHVPPPPGPTTRTIRFDDAALKALTIAGNGDSVISVNDGATSLATVNGSSATGAITFGTPFGGSTLITVNGGSGNDTLTANRDQATLIGNGGNDTLIVNANLVTLTGGAGADTFNVASPVTNSSGYASITDASAGDFLKFSASAANFKSASIALAGTAVFQDYANEAVKRSAFGDVSWFQFGGDTYAVENRSASATDFQNGTDVIVRLVGLLDLSTASMSSSNDTVLVIGG